MSPGSSALGCLPTGRVEEFVGVVPRPLFHRRLRLLVRYFADAAPAPLPGARVRVYISSMQSLEDTGGWR